LRAFGLGNSRKVPERLAMRILALSGSLRAKSTNTALLVAAAELATPHVSVSVYRNLSRLPHFNPDLEDNLPAEVCEFHSEVHACSGLLISTPEYAHGIPGGLKNALDWLVGGSGFIGKPVTLLNASGRGVFAQDSLIEIPRGFVLEPLCLSV
jgi:chromate reductase